MWHIYHETLRSVQYAKLLFVRMKFPPQDNHDANKAMMKMEKNNEQMEKYSEQTKK